MRDILRKARPQRLDDLIALNALYRPGPLRSGMVDDFIARKAGKTEVKYELPQLEPILSETYGVIAYQDQVMRISNVLAGFSPAEADLLRAAMGKKNPEVMAKQRGKFLEGAKKNGIAEKKAGEGAIESLLDVRRKQGRIASLHALCEDLDLRLANRRVFESLIKAGAFDSVARESLNGHANGEGASQALRPRLMAAIDAAC